MGAIVPAAMLALPVPAAGQGCVPLRHYGGGCAGAGSGSFLEKNDWQAGASFRHFKSFRHFRGDDEEHERIEEGSEVINYSNALDLIVAYALTNRVSASITLPFVHNQRSSLYEHGGNKDASGNVVHANRHSTYSQGLGDIRIGASYWVRDPSHNDAGNLQVGLGVKLPTGEYQATDWFYNQTVYDKNGQAGKEKLLLPVDQSIQPGDGGWGILLEFLFFHQIHNRFSAYAGGFYLSNPGATNGGVTRNLTTELSIPDQYSLRAGLSRSFHAGQLILSLGGRADGVPATDLIGSSEGYRRPGYAISIEPGATWQRNRLTVFVNIPVAVYRNRTKSYLDKARDIADPAVDHHGDAAFSDFVLLAGMTLRLPSCGHRPMMPDPIVPAGE